MGAEAAIVKHWEESRNDAASAPAATFPIAVAPAWSSALPVCT